MSARVDLSRWDTVHLAESFARAEPFSHVVIDDFLDSSHVSELVDAFEEEPAENIQDEIFDVMASAAPPVHEALRSFHDALGAPAVLRAIREITGEAVSGVETRAYVYLPGHYLLPHADRDASGRRRVAYAFYAATRGALSGGELDLYRCDLEAGRIVHTEIAKTILPRPNRCVLFGVAPHTLHRVREVTAGARLSLAGWFLQ